MTESDSNSMVKTDTWEAEYVRLEVPMYPVLDRQSVQIAVQSRKSRKAADHMHQMRGATSFVTNVHEADRRAQNLISECKRRIAADEFSALIDLVRDYPVLCEDVSVRQLILRYGQIRRMRQKPGRQRGSFERCPLMVVGLVASLIKEGFASNPERACGLLEEMGLVTSYEAASRSFYRTLGDDRFRAVLARLPIPAHRRSASELEEWIKRSPVLQPGQSTSYMVNCPGLGSQDVEVQISATPLPNDSKFMQDW